MAKKSFLNQYQVPIMCGLFALVGAAAGWGVTPKQPVEYKRPSNVITTDMNELTDDDLNKVLGVYIYKGKSVEVTNRDALMFANQGTMPAATKGKYAVPSAKTVMQIAQDSIIQQVLDEKQITVTDDDVTKYIKDNFKVNSISELAKSYNVSENYVEQLMRTNARVKKLRAQVCPTQVPEAPEEPTAPKDDQKDVATKEYADYIFKIAGNEWDSSARDGKGNWKDKTSAYATALSAYKVSNDSATYEAARAAYGVASSTYQRAVSSETAEWTKYIDGYMSQVVVETYSAYL